MAPKAMKAATKAMKAVKAVKRVKSVMKKKTLSFLASRVSAGKRVSLLKTKAGTLTKKTISKVVKVVKPDEIGLSSEEVRDKRRTEVMVSKNFPEIVKKIAKFDAERLAKEPAMEVTEGEDEAWLEKLNKAVELGMRLHEEAWHGYVFERDRGNADGEEREDRAAAFRENAVCQDYEQLREVLSDLLPFVAPMQMNAGKAGEVDYHVVSTEGFTPPQHLDEGEVNYKLLGARLAKGLPESEKLLGSRLACLRSQPRFRALEALAAVMATICGRKEKSFVELFGTRAELEENLDKLIKKGKCPKSKEGSVRKQKILEYLQHEAHYGHGYFAHWTVKPDATFRVALQPSMPRSIPACMLITERVPLYNCLGSENDDDADAPICGAAKCWSWCVQPGRQFALQEANFAVEKESDRNSRAPAIDLQPDDALRDLILSRKPVIYLECVASLAPRDVSKAQGHTEIIKAELTQVMRVAKERGEAVVFCLGSDSPHTLAKKVYLRKPTSDYGLKCGYMRWRGSADEPWAREKQWDNRTCLCLQMP